MSTAQNIIKYLAIAFAVFLIAMIVSGIASAGAFILKGLEVFPHETKSNVNHDLYSSYLDINVKYAELKIVKGTELKVENNNEKIIIIEDTNKLLITDKSTWFDKNKEEIIIYVPENFKYDLVKINFGAGKLSIDGFNAKKIDIDLGATDSIINNINGDDVRIDSGTGSLKINNSILNNANIDSGVGELIFNGDITGKSKISSGIGKLELNLDRAEREYMFEIDKGIGDITLNNNHVMDDSVIGDSLDYIKVDSGIGSININTK